MSPEDTNSVSKTLLNEVYQSVKKKVQLGNFVSFCDILIKDRPLNIMVLVIRGRMWTLLDFRLAISTILFFAISFIIFNVIYYVQPTPFIDEIFHIPQAQKFCNWSFQEWDQKITTLPGLYLLTIGVYVPLSKLLKVNLCTVYWLRFFNVVTACVNYYIIYKIQRHIRPLRLSRRAKLQDMMGAINLATFPVLYFFSFLYYTDTLSTCLVLLLYLLKLQKHSILAAMIGFVAVLVRQNNIIWVAYIATVSVCDSLKVYAQIFRGHVSLEFMRTRKYFKLMKISVVNALKRRGRRRRLFKIILKASWSYLIVGISFFIFVILNGGLVVGDRSAHQAVIHIPQMFYFFSFTVFFTLPYVLSGCKYLLQTVFENGKEVFCMQVVFIFIVHINTLVHPYLLADNRHYTFYVWKRFYENGELAKYGYVCLYILGGLTSYRMLKETDIFFKFGFFVFTFLCLVPQKLLEFRYFIIPFALLRIHFCARSWRLLAMEQAFYVAINASTIFIFVTRVFYWPDSEAYQRIIW